jgi:prevent-host-death family protein
MIQPSDIHTLTEFKRNSTELIARLERSGRPQVLTVEGRPKAVVLAVEAFQRMADLAQRAETIEGIRRGLADVDAGRTMPLEEFEAALRKRLGLDPRD